MREKQTPDNEQLTSLATILYQKVQNEKNDRSYASTKKVLSMIGIGLGIASALITPQASFLLAKKNRSIV